MFIINPQPRFIELIEKYPNGPGFRAPKQDRADWVAAELTRNIIKMGFFDLSMIRGELKKRGFPGKGYDWHINVVLQNHYEDLLKVNTAGLKPDQRSEALLQCYQRWAPEIVEHIRTQTALRQPLTPIGPVGLIFKINPTRSLPFYADY